MSGRQCGRVKSPMRFVSDEERKRAFLITASFIDMDFLKMGRRCGTSNVAGGCENERQGSSYFGGSFSHLIRLLWTGLLTGRSGRLNAPVVKLRIGVILILPLRFCKHCRSGVVMSDVIVLLAFGDGLLKSVFFTFSFMLRHFRALESSLLFSGVFDVLLMSLQMSELRSPGICVSPSRLSRSISSMKSSSVVSHEPEDSSRKLWLDEFIVLESASFDGVLCMEGDDVLGRFGSGNLNAVAETVVLNLLLLKPQ